VCEPECPAEAIIPDTDPAALQWVEVNTKFAESWPNITRKAEAPADADAWKGVADKFAQHFSAEPAKR
jgi:ferredoxin